LVLDIPLQLIFYTDNGNDIIAVISTNGSDNKVIIKENLDKPRAIVTDSVHR